MATFPFELVSPERQLFAGDVESVVVPASEGDMTILPQHAPVMTTLRAGIVSIVEGKGETNRLYVEGGFADVSPAGLTLLAEKATPLSEIDAATLETSLKAAQDALANAKDAVELSAAQESLDGLKALQQALAH